MQVWLDGKADIKAPDEAFAGSKCLQCGCCLEICVSFVADEDFVGTAGMVPMARLLSEMPKEQEERTKTAYHKYFYEGCDHFNACHQICPAGIDTAHLAVHSEAVAMLSAEGGVVG